MGEGGAVVVGGRAAGADRPLVPRLGPRLLLQRRREQHLRQAFQPAVRHAALRLRPQVRLFARRLQPEGDRHPGGHRLRQLKKLDGFIAARRRNWAALRRDARALRRPAPAAGNAARQRAVLLRLRDHRPARRRLHAQRTGRLPGGGEDRDPQPFLRQPRAAPGLRRDRVPHRRRPAQHRRRS